MPISGFSNRLLLIEAKPEKRQNEQWLKSQIEALPTIARLAKDEIIKPFSYSELTHEAMRRPGSFPPSLFGDVFRSTNIIDMPSAIERSKIFSLGYEQLRDSSGLNNYVGFLINGGASRLLRNEYIKNRLTEFEIESINQISDLKNICSGLSKIQYSDAFHFWSAIRNKMDYFVLIDKKFVNAVTANGSARFPCTLIYPSDLLSILEIRERDPLPYLYGRRYLLNGRLYE
ncbi:hypothetical protein [Hansschlegelia zhihuaiae]|uniref:Uncharacterized protein n=1 Tax=Hansschlegelia zhihuaiae TaxID=405005 RepID=A0A4Q0MKK9_9HYPH|nr:hypothetical protein [Hansschlegelia zhihuaiae]RXF73973.1 hypothetical protein EK403_08380 [Hansschlegelia zhihuaiae]